ncbi:hypothetical protein [Maribacter cobaltidurans]|uniref:Uncharacterized protein n=1 Tax=Maribacter cobaltidurans TaxID=1178778 RepID=A0A223V422_9FLAO|nr:hypothetical protein [Maribacter cobaltidurans]ASV29748.1 hypothetical protein CJ263_05670 [Maribacter cobaltidurans]GGD92915.1 hypothetical protein GCM10011412_33570 [Maribacter cobaltidurans]
MKLRFIKYGLPFVLTLLCGLYLVHSNLKVEDTSSINLVETFLQPNDTNQNASVGINPSSSPKRLAVEVAESEEQEEEIRHTIPAENSRYSGSNSTSYAHTNLDGFSVYSSRVSNHLLNVSGTIFPYRRYIRFQVFRL